LSEAKDLATTVEARPRAQTAVMCRQDPSLRSRMTMRAQRE
jgi:hypothetical protein